MRSTQLPLPSIQPGLPLIKPFAPPQMQPKSPPAPKIEHSDGAKSEPSTPLSAPKSPENSPPPKLPLNFPVFEHNQSIQKLLLQKIGQAALAAERKDSGGELNLKVTV